MPRQCLLSRSSASSASCAIQGDRVEALYLVALALGLRRGEALGLKWDDVDFDSGLLRVSRQLHRVDHGQGRQLFDTKTRAGRRVLVLLELAIAKLRQHQQRQQVERLERA